MASAKRWDEYAEHLALLGEYNPAYGIGADVAGEVRRGASSEMVVVQGIQILRQVWSTLPQGVREQALKTLDDVGEMVFDAFDGSMDSIPVIGAIIKAGITSGMRIAEASKILKDWKKAKTNFAHGEAEQKTIYGAFDMGETWGGVQGSYQGGLFVRANVYEYARFIKVRGGGDYDRKPSFARPGGARDAIFLGSPSPKGSGCKKDMRRSGSESLGPFEPKCGRTMGLSASLWPWWSTAYEAKPLTRWVVDPAATFQLPPSPDTNASLTTLQAALITDPERNLRASLRDVEVKTRTFLAWWDKAGGRVYKMRDGIVQEGGEYKRIDSRKDASHKLHKTVGSYWYYDDSGYIRTYKNQTGDTGLGGWGIALPQDGDPKNLGVTLEQYNAVLASRAAFAQRRLATLRTPGLVEALIINLGGMKNIDSGARDAILYAKDANGMLPYPGDRVQVKRMVFQAPTPGSLTKKAVMARPGAKVQRAVAGRIPPFGGSKSSGGATPLILGAAVLGLIVLKNK